jgi:hypothetical protein
MLEKYHQMMTLGVIGRCDINDLQQIKNDIEKITGFRVVYFKAASGRLWLRTDDS